MGARVIEIEDYNRTVSGIHNSFTGAINAAFDHIEGKVTDRSWIDVINRRANALCDDLRYYMSFQNIDHHGCYNPAENREAMGQKYLDEVALLECELYEAIRHTRSIKKLRERFEKLAGKYVDLYYNNVAIA